MDNEEKYNGWTNRATWNVDVWLSNDREIYKMMKALKMSERNQFENFCVYLWGNETPDGERLSDVNWQEIADAWNNK